MITIYDRPIAKKNNNRFNGKFVYKTKAWKNFEKSALMQLSQVKERYTGAVSVDYTFFCKGKLTIDNDNGEGGINDLLEKAGIIDNDKNIVRWSGRKFQGEKEWKTEIVIEKL